MSDLVDRLRAEIDATEADAQGLYGPGGEYRWSDTGERWDASGNDVLDRDEQVVVSGRAAAHIARHDPASVLRRCAADRKILELHTENINFPGSCDACYVEDDLDIQMRVEQSWPCPTLLALAEGYGVTKEET